MRRYLLIALLALACATPVRPDQALYGVCASYTIAAMRGAELAQSGALPVEVVIAARVHDQRAYEGCKAGVALINAGQDPSAATEVVQAALAEFERILAARVEPGSVPVDPETGTPAP